MFIHSIVVKDMIREVLPQGTSGAASFFSFDLSCFLARSRNIWATHEIQTKKIGQMMYSWIFNLMLKKDHFTGFGCFSGN